MNRPFAGSGHIVRNKLRWDANNSVRLLKQRNSYQSTPTFRSFASPTALFASQRNLFRTMWLDPAKGLFLTMYLDAGNSLKCILGIFQDGAPLVTHSQIFSTFQDGSRVKFPTLGIVVDVKTPTFVRFTKSNSRGLPDPPILGQTIDRCTISPLITSDLSREVLQKWVRGSKAYWPNVLQPPNQAICAKFEWQRWFEMYHLLPGSACFETFTFEPFVS